MADWSLKWPNLNYCSTIMVVFKLHGSIDPMESVKFSSVNYFWQIQDGNIQDGIPLLSKHHFVPEVTFDQP